MKRSDIYSLLLGLTVFLAAGCIREDNDNCATGVDLRFRYLLNETYTDRFAADVDGVAVYVFDDEGLYVNTYSAAQSALIDGNTMHLPLAAGVYTALVWGGPDARRHAGEAAPGGSFRQGLRKGATTLGDFRMMLYGGADSDPAEIAAESDELFYGKSYDIVSQRDLQTSVVDLIKDTHRLNVTIEGVGNLSGVRAAETLPVIRCAASDCLYTYENLVPADARRIVYLPYSSNVEGDRMQAVIKTRRLSISAPAAQATVLTVTNPATGHEIYNGGVVAAIMSLKDGAGNHIYATQEDIDRQDTYDFVIRIGFDVEISVWINGWEVKNINPEI